MPGLVPGIRVFGATKQGREWPGQARPFEEARQGRLRAIADSIFKQPGKKSQSRHCEPTGRREALPDDRLR
jgi:hypothetical protein